MTDTVLSTLLYVWFGVSAVMLIGWLILNRRRRGALAETSPRSHDLRLTDVMCAALAYVLAMVFAQQILAGTQDPSWARYEASFAAMLAGQLLAAAVAIVIGRMRFAHGLAGWGLTAREPVRITAFSMAYFVTAAGLMFAILALTILICRGFGYEQVQQHEFLELLERQPPLLGTSLLVASAVLTGPFAEELLFRGILQNSLIAAIGKATADGRSTGRTYWTAGRCRWAAILIASLIFAAFHGDLQHWPALLVLGVMLGYGYERHGSLWLPIIAHGMFNLASIALTAVQL